MTQAPPPSSAGLPVASGKRRLVKPLLAIAGIVIVAGFTGFWVLTSPTTWALLHPKRDVADASPANIGNGRDMFYAGGCGTCHASPGQAEETRLGGGVALKSAFGTFYMPNISPDAKDGIGGWTTAQFVDAMRAGVSAHGGNEYPSLPYTSFQRMTANDTRDLFGYIKTLPAVPGKVRDHDLNFPFNIRRGIGVWKLVFLDGEPLPAAPGKSASWLRGRYLVEGPGHCAECHSPRDPIGAIVTDKRFGGAADPEGDAYVPNITPDDTGIGYWSVHEIASYLNDGISPIGLPAGHSMTAVVANMAHLSPADRTAMAEYVKSLPPVDAPNQGVPPPNRTATIRMLPPSAGKTPSPAAVLAVPAAIAAQSKTLYAVATKPLFLTKPDGAGGAGDGKLLPAAEVQVIAADGDWLQVKVSGWQQQGAEASVTTLEGQRILVATLDPAAMAKMSREKTVKDAGTGLTWFEGSLTGWVSKSDLNPSLPAIWTYAGTMYGATCGTCHAAHPTDAYLANQWIGNLKAMKRFTSLDDGQYRLLLAYLQLHSKDAGPAEAAAAKPGPPL